MRKIITLSPEKMAIAQELMRETLTDTLSQLLSALMLSYQQNKKRPQGRPRTKSEEEADEDTTTLYKAPDWPDNLNAYTLEQLREYYDYDPRRGPMPPVEELETHPDSPTKHD